MWYLWRTDVIFLHRDKYLCICSKAINSFLGQLLSQVRLFYFFLFLLFILVKNIKSVWDNDGPISPFHIFVSFINTFILDYFFLFVCFLTLGCPDSSSIISLHLLSKSKKLKDPFLIKCINFKVSKLDGINVDIIMLKLLNLAVTQLDNVLCTINVYYLHLWFGLC